MLPQLNIETVAMLQRTADFFPPDLFDTGGVYKKINKGLWPYFSLDIHPIKFFLKIQNTTASMIVFSYQKLIFQYL